MYSIVHTENSIYTVFLQALARAGFDRKETMYKTNKCACRELCDMHGCEFFDYGRERRERERRQEREFEQGVNVEMHNLLLPLTFTTNEMGLGLQKYHTVHPLNWEFTKKIFLMTDDEDTRLYPEDWLPTRIPQTAFSDEPLFYTVPRRSTEGGDE